MAVMHATLDIWSRTIMTHPGHDQSRVTWCGQFALSADYETATLFCSARAGRCRGPNAQEIRTMREALSEHGVTKVEVART